MLASLVIDAPQSLNTAQWIAFVIRIVALVGIGLFTGFCLYSLKNSIEQKAIGIETSWGGLGGSLGGWTASKSLTWFVASMVSIILFLTLALHLSDGLETAPKTTSTTDTQKADISKKGQDTKNEASPTPVSGSASDQSKAQGTPQTENKTTSTNPERK